MIDLNELITSAFSTIESTIPGAVVNGRLVKYEAVYNRTTSKYDKTESDSQSIKCVFDYSEEAFRTAENSDTIIAKILVFGYLAKPVSMFDEVILSLSDGDVVYKTDKLRKVNVGESSALHTFIITR